jgi:hypothetical protein
MLVLQLPPSFSAATCRYAYTSHPRPLYSTLTLPLSRLDALQQKQASLEAELAAKKAAIELELKRSSCRQVTGIWLDRGEGEWAAAATLTNSSSLPNHRN